MGDSATTMELTEGWTWLYNATRWHYFVENRSLCGKWAYFGSDLRAEDGVGTLDCRECRRRLMKRLEKKQS